MRPPVSAPVENAQKTLKAAGIWDGNQLAAFPQKDWSKLGLQWAEFEKRASDTASADFQKIQISFMRDGKKTIEYAEMSSKEGLVSSGILAPELGEKFADTLGDVLLVAVPSRHRAFVFPRFGPDVSRFSGLVWGAYRESSYPVSVELFEWRKGTLRAIGCFEP